MFTTLRCALLHLILVSSIAPSIQLSASEQNADLVPPSFSLWDSVYAGIMAEFTRPTRQSPVLPRYTPTTIALVATLPGQQHPESKVSFSTDTKTFEISL